MKTLDNFLVEKKNVLLRLDLNIPLKDGIIIDKTRLYAIKPTISKLRLKKNKIFLLSHLGRPKGKYNKKYSLKFLVNILSNILSVKKIYFLPSFSHNEICTQINSMLPGDICLLENVRFNEGEEQNDKNFSKKLASNFDVFVNDAFSVSHRQHASIVGITNFLPSLAGYSLIKEIQNLNKLLNNSHKPSTAIIGGSKVSSKLLLLNNLLELFDTLVIGGAMANTFLFALGHNVGKSLVESELIYDAKKIILQSKELNTNLILPVDLVCSDSLNHPTKIKLASVQNIPLDHIALDIGDATVELIRNAVSNSNLVLWNGPLGAFEYKPFDVGTNKILEVIITNFNRPIFTSIAGGGDTVAAIKKYNAEKSFTYISNAGGAFLEWLEGKDSPGISALKNNKQF